MLPLQNVIRIALWKYLFFFHWLSRNLLYSSLTSLNSLKIHQVKILSLTNISQWKDRICSCNTFGWGFLFSRLWLVGQFLLCFLGGIFYSAVCFFVCLVVWSIVFGCGFGAFLYLQILKEYKSPRKPDFEIVFADGSFASGSPRISISPLYTN